MALELQTTVKPSSNQIVIHRGTEGRPLLAGDTIKIETDGVEWLIHELTNNATVTVTVVIEE